jgi:hypothetical protein
MSNIAIQGAATGTGVFTLASPATNTDRTLVLPDEAGTVLTSVSDLPAGNLTGSVPASIIPAGSVIQTVFKIFGDSTTSTTANTFVPCVNADLAITTKLANSKLLVKFIGQGYQASGQGINLGLNRTISGTSVRLLGIDGTGGNAWQGAGNGVPTISFTIERLILDSPAQAAGTTITYTGLLGIWVSGTGYLNYPTYSSESMILIQEIAP